MPDLAAEGLLEDQPADPTEIAAWLERLRVAAEAVLPADFTLKVPVSDADLELRFELTAPDWDPGERQYTLASWSELTPHPGQEPSALSAGALVFSGTWLVTPGLRGPVRDTWWSAVQVARENSEAASHALAVAELHRVVRLRERCREAVVRFGRHDQDIAELQATIAQSLSV